MAILIIKYNKVIEQFYKSDFADYSTDNKKRVYDLKHKSGCDFICDCSKSKPELTIRQKNNNYYIVSFPNQRGRHSESCSFHSNYKGTNEHEKGWIENEEGILIATLSTNVFGKKEPSAPVEGGVNPVLRRLYTGGNGVSKVTLLGLMSKLNLMSWDKYLKRENKTPENLKIFLRQTFGVANNILINKKKNLNNYWFGFDKFKTLKEGDFLFVYMPVQEIRKTKSDKYSNIMLSYFINDKEETLLIGCKSDLLREAHIRVRERDLEREGNDFKTIAGGFIRKNSQGYKEFVSLEFMPIIPQGLWAESSYEETIYLKLIQEGRLFSKGYMPVEAYGNFIPDIIFRDTLKPCYGEIFGIRNIEEYNERKEEKKHLAEISNDKFDFWYWDVTKNQIPPSF